MIGRHDTQHNDTQLIMGLFITIRINGTQNNRQYQRYAECRFIYLFYAKCHYAVSLC
jgi:hypothetical protein